MSSRKMESEPLSSRQKPSVSLVSAGGWKECRDLRLTFD